MVFNFTSGFYKALPSIIIFSLICFFISCEQKTEEKTHAGYNEETVPSVISFNDSILYSDSGRVQMKVIAEKIVVFNKAKEPYTLFPNKVYMEQYDSVMTVVTKLWADSAWNFSKQRLWKLRGNVKIIKDNGTMYESEELFWDEAKDRIYSDKFVTIYEPDKGIQRAQKFESNQNLTDYTFYRVKDGEYYFSDKSNEANTEK